MTIKNRNFFIRQLWLFSISFLLFLIISNLFFLLNVPPIWPDEALHADLSLNILKFGVTGTNLLSGTLPGVETFGFGYPPFYFYTSALWFKIFGFSIFNYRLLSFFLGIVLLILFALVSRKLSDKAFKKVHWSINFLLMIGAWLLLTDIAFVKVIHIARPEIEVIVLGFLSIFFYLKISETKNERIKMLFSIGAGISLGLAFITHFLAIIFLLSLLLFIITSNFKNFYRQKEVYIFGLTFLAVLAIWLISIFPYLNYFLNDITLRMNYKADVAYWIGVISFAPLITKIIFLLYLLISWELLMTFLIFRNFKTLLILYLNLSSWVFTYMWKTEYSFIYTVIFSYLTLIYLLINSQGAKDLLSKLKFRVYIVIVISLLILNSINLFKQFQKNDFSYQVYIDSLRPLIPSGSSVYLSAIPDPYFAFSGTHTLYEFPVLPTSKQNLEKVLDSVDYIVFNQPLETLVISENVVIPYIQNNAEEFQNVGGLDQYKATVVKLKPKDQRLNK